MNLPPEVQKANAKARAEREEAEAVVEKLRLLKRLEGGNRKARRRAQARERRK